MTWRRIAPWVILAITLLALYIDIPRKSTGATFLPLPDSIRTVLGLDLQGGISVTLEVQSVSGEEPDPERVELARAIIERRVAGLGVTEPQVRTEVGANGEARIVVEVPGVSDRNQILQLVGSTGQLLFLDPMAETLTEGQNVVDLIGTGAISVLFDGGEIQQGSVVPDTSQSGQVGVSFTLTPEAQEIWCNYTTGHVNQPGPIALDGEVITTPTIQQPICGGRTIITVGAGTAAVAEQTTLYNQLRFGALPVSLTVQEVTAIQPTLGRDFLVQAIIAGTVGLLLVLFFMIANYRLPGVLASLALIFYTLVVYAIFRIIPVTLTLAGVAAFILSIGMAVDANILIFERMKEEIRAGKTLGPAIEAGFNRAWSSILDSNVSSLLIAIWLFWQGTSVIRGFALVLGIGVLVSMFSAVVVTRTLLRMVTHREWGRRIEYYHVER
ncbi:MAG TPA: protein translocase subunit SecD [Candidatus Limnocylindria bacterium]|nr:protein translocase subunit SecD [Candidatus Limnocylindria bacterium]